MMSRKLFSLIVLAAALAFSAIAGAQPTAAWPDRIDTPDGEVTFFQPQLDDFHDNQLWTRAAVAVQLNGRPDQVFGAVWFHDTVQVDPAARTVQVLQVNVDHMRIPGDDPIADRAVRGAADQLFAGRDIVLNLDGVLHTLDVLHKEQAQAAAIQSSAPAIIFRDHPAVKLQYDGAPRLSPVDNSNLMRAVNTPMFVVLDPDSRTYFLKGGGRWFAAPDAMGPFQQVGDAPAAVAALAVTSGYQDPTQPPSVDPNTPVEIVTATEPTELIWTNGAAQMSPIDNTNLLYVANTDSDLFLTLNSPRYFVLLSGRWYSAAREDGPWAFVPPDQMPGDFQRIPPDGAKGGVLVSVPGTQAATDALADAYVPQTSAVDVAQFNQPPVVYDGDAVFEPIDGTDMSYATNTGAAVVLVNGRYYCCDNAVWYVADSANGPWGIATAVPAEIYTIPPSCPIYPVRFVYIYGHGPGVVYFGYLPGYTGSYVYNGVLVYGTGFHYRPWIGHTYFQRPYTYGFAAHYDWYTGRWGFDFALALGGGDAVIFGGPHNGWFGFGGFHAVYARDRAHMDVAARRFADDRARQGGVVGAYDRHDDARRAAPAERPLENAPRQEQRSDRSDRAAPQALQAAPNRSARGAAGDKAAAPSAAPSDGAANVGGDDKTRGRRGSKGNGNDVNGGGGGGGDQKANSPPPQ